MPPHIGTDDRKAMLLQEARKVFIPLLVFLHPVDDLHSRPRPLRLENMEFQTITVLRIYEFLFHASSLLQSRISSIGMRLPSASTTSPA